MNELRKCGNCGRYYQVSSHDLATGFGETCLMCVSFGRNIIDEDMCDDEDEED